MILTVEILETRNTASNSADIFIAVVGATGSGKSSSSSDMKVAIGRGLDSETSHATPCKSNVYSDRNLWLLDTPGFDDMQRSDTDVFTEISAWIATTYSSGIRLSGILYLHDISTPRLTGVTERLRLLEDLCGLDSQANITLVTTFWDYVKDRKNEYAAVGREWTLKEDSKVLGLDNQEGEFGCTSHQYSGVSQGDPRHGRVSPQGQALCTSVWI